MTTAPTDFYSNETRMTRLEETMRAFLTLLDKETAAVQAADLDSFGRLQTIKKDLFDLFQTDAHALLERKTELKSLPAALKTQMKDLEVKFSTARINNMSAIDRAHKSFGRLRDRIMHIARDTALKTNAQYGSNGALRLRTNRAISTGIHDRV